MNDQTELEVSVRERLEEIKYIPVRDPMIANRARAQFLAKAVSAGNVQRHKGWNFIFRKEQFAMNMIVSILVVASLLFGGGATVNAAQNDLPGEPLYSLKVWSEDVRLQFQKTPEAKVERLMEMAETRIQEMAQLTVEGKPIPDSVPQRLEQHLQQALQICTSMDDAVLDRTLLQVRDRLQQQEQDMDRLQLHTQSKDTLQLLTQTRAMLHERLQLVEDGLLNHDMFRNTVRTGQRNGQENNTTPTAENGYGQQNGQPTSMPGGQNPDPGEPNTDPGNPSVTPGSPNTDPGGPNLNPGGPNTESGGQNTNENSPDSGNNNDSSGNGTDGSRNGSGGNSTGGNRP